MMFLRNIKKSAFLALGIGVVGLMMVGCGGTNGASDIGTVPGPGAGEKVTITAANADKVLASTVGGVGKIAALIEDLVDKLPNISKTNTDYAVATSGKSVSASDKFALTLVSRDCADGGSISVNSLSTTGGSVTFNSCSERGIVLDGSADISVNGSNYDIAFTNVNATFSTGTLNLTEAGASISGGQFDFRIASGTANVQGIAMEVKNFQLVRDESGNKVSGSIKTACMGGWVDVSTTDPLKYNASKVLVGGKMLIEGNSSSMLVEVNADGSINVSLNGSPYASYPSSSDLPQYNAVCS